MAEYYELLVELPEEIRKPLAKLIDRIEERLRSLELTREEFNRLRRAVEELI